MDKDNERRLIAAEIVRLLWVNKNVAQLELLEIQVRRSLEELRKNTESTANEYHTLNPSRND